MALIWMALQLLLMKLNKWFWMIFLPGIHSSGQKVPLHGLPPISEIDIENSFIRHFMVANSNACSQHSELTVTCENVKPFNVLFHSIISMHMSSCSPMFFCHSISGVTVSLGNNNHAVHAAGV